MTVFALIVGILIVIGDFMNLKMKPKKEYVEKRNKILSDLKDASDDEVKATKTISYSVLFLVVLFYIMIGSMMGGMFMVISALLAIYNIDTVNRISRQIKMAKEGKEMIETGNWYYFDKFMNLASMLIHIVFVIFLIFSIIM
jgi:hypothetical protein